MLKRGRMGGGGVAYIYIYICIYTFISVICIYVYTYLYIPFWEAQRLCFERVQDTVEEGIDHNTREVLRQSMSAPRMESCHSGVTFYRFQVTERLKLNKE